MNERQLRMTDKDLILKTLDNDRAAFADLVDRYRDAVCGVAYHYLGNFDDVQDAAQEAFLQAYSNLPRLREPEKFGPWVRQITTNVCLQTLRRKDNRNLPLENAPEQSTEDDAHKSAMRLVVREALAKLSDITRLTVTLCYINGYSHDEVAQFLEVPLNTVRSRLRIAKKQLREEMMTMVHDVLHEDKPDDELTRKVMEIAERKREALNTGQIDVALSCDDEETELMEQLKAESSPEEFKQKVCAAFESADIPDLPLEVKEKELRRLRKMSPQKLYVVMKSGMLRDRGSYLARLGKHQESVDYYRRSAELAGEAGLLYQQGIMLHWTAIAHLQAGRGDLGMPYLRESADVHRRLRKWKEAGDSLWMLGNLHINIEEVDKGLEVLAESREMYEKGRCTEGLLANQAVSDLVNEVGIERFHSLIFRSTNCFILREQDKAVSLQRIEGWEAGPPEKINSIFRCPVFILAQRMKEMVKPSVPAGESWTHDVNFDKVHNVRFQATVKSKTAVITTPLGTFHDCLHIEQSLVETNYPDYYSDDTKQHMHTVYGGVRSTWFAPGVGLVKLHITTGDNHEATIQLQDYHTEKQTKDYFPLAIGNTWTYTWSGIPGGLSGKEVYKVAGRKRNEWYLEHYYYVLEPAC